MHRAGVESQQSAQKVYCQQFLELINRLGLSSSENDKHSVFRFSNVMISLFKYHCKLNITGFQTADQITEPNRR